MNDLASQMIKQRFYALFPPGSAFPPAAVPIFINSFNRLNGLRRLVDWLLDSGHRRIVLLDNCSTYPPLLRYFETLEEDQRITVVRLDKNFGQYAIWTSGIFDRLNWDAAFAYSDPDVLPDAHCPSDFIAHFDDVLARHPWAMKAGFGLLTDDIPDSYKFRDEVLTWEKQFWDVPVGFMEFRAPIDSTFALYRREAVHWNFQATEDAKYMAIRTGAPYVARHLDWYIDSDHPTEEQIYYREKAIPGITNWSLEALPDNVQRDIDLVRHGVRIIPLDSQQEASDRAMRTPGILGAITGAVKRWVGR